MNNDIFQEHHEAVCRRHFFGQMGLGLGTAALASLLPAAGSAGEASSPAPARHGGLPELPHFPPTAKRAIYLFMAGAPSQLDTFDYKPKLTDLFQQDLRKLPDITQMQPLTTMTSGQSSLPIAPSKYKFEQCGQSGAWISELLPHHRKMADDMAIVRTVNTEAINHDPAITYICTGHQLPGRASLGSWLNYGLGSLNETLPSFVVMTPSWTGRPDAQALYNRLWGSGFLPSEHSGVALRRAGDPVLFLSDPPGVSRAMRERMVESLVRLNERTHAEIGDPATKARIDAARMAFKMQTSVPELVDISDEPKHVLEMYGPDVEKPGTFAHSALLARRMAERDVRFVQIFHRGWDQHFNISGHLPAQCRDVDQPSWALVQDLKQRGLLDDTLVVWGGEFGRTVYCQGNLTRENYGRDHHPRNFCIWMAGGGVKGGVVHGETDDF
ncbi:MAG: DUF1501 domain-containing protein, partial [Planctomycetales bacterium]|nr:DUF1501 domain-containing protein [Planctomycetales bacterium]